MTPSTRVASEVASSLEEAQKRLAIVLRECAPAVIAVSGGVDSLTLAEMAIRTIGDEAILVHATSPAVPDEATRRVKAFAAERSVRLTVMDAGEFSDEQYRRNPVNRCYFCKSHLYDAIRARVPGVGILSGANWDDLGDYRPGLRAAEERGVRHPLVEAGLTKARVRELARSFGLGDIAELPSAPCLSSRVETGIRIEAPALGLIDAVESEIRAAIAPSAVRCRVRHHGLVVELDEVSLASLSDDALAEWSRRVEAHASRAGMIGRVTFAPYRQGSAFLR
jgi:uncharacterized protein